MAISIIWGMLWASLGANWKLLSTMMSQSTRTGELDMLTYETQAGVNPRPARICPGCSRIGSVSTAKAQKLFLTFLPIKSWMVWRCRKCGWARPITADWEPAVSNAMSDGRPSTAQEVNPMFRMAEGWYRPPSDIFAGTPEQTPVQLGSIDYR
ncbi:hypothetical protein DFH08DRAFT_821787 [Mycena albidolilacea]|uniref:Zinc-ribbon 15 domain-containing protein n=1 Tax=Mycena albidolilacea TaxID=1033008 RepID=A0AAD6ZA90_9AGAR|nr:hypothetical protein DFH08DRAFT_821787 [Mycena albidolilacea]